MCFTFCLVVSFHLFSFSNAATLIFLLFMVTLQNTGRTFLETDGDILETISSSFRDDGSTALAAVLIGKRLYVANVGDSRAVASKAGKGKVAARKKRPKRTAPTFLIFEN